MPLSVEREIFIPETAPIPAMHHPHPLDNIDLSFQGVETQHSTHIIHPYVAAINPPLASRLIQSFVPQNGSILDPFCGGGGVLVEGILQGKSVTGNDINPLAVSISKAKTAYISGTDILNCYEQFVLSQGSIYIQQSEIDAIPSTIRYWFKDYALKAILTIKRFIDGLDTELAGSEKKAELINLYQVILSATIRDVMLTYRGEVRLRRLQGIDYERFNPDVFLAFQKRSFLAAERVSALPNRPSANVTLEDARNMSYHDDQFSTIICSPPYGDDKNGVGYFQFSSKMLYFLGLENLQPYRKLFLGGVKENKSIPPSQSLRASLENVYHHDRTHFNEAVAFYCDYFNAIREMQRVTSDRVIIVIGSRVLSRTSFNNAQITVEMFESLGTDLEYHFQRMLPKKRIANLGGDGGGGNLEDILVFRI